MNFNTYQFVQLYLDHYNPIYTPSSDTGAIHLPLAWSGYQHKPGQLRTVPAKVGSRLEPKRVLTLRRKLNCAFLSLGETKGIEKGILLKRHRLARQLLPVMDDQTMATLTGLSLAEVEQLRL